MAILMIAAVTTVSAFAVEEGEYTASLTVNLPDTAPPHTLNFFSGPAEVTNEDEISTVTIPLLNPATITVTPPYGPPSVQTGTIVGATVDLPYTVDLVDYDNDGIADALVVTAPEGLTPFAPVITFSVSLQSGQPHSDVPATLTLS